MDRGTRIARAIGRAHDRLRPIFNREQCLKILTGDQQAYTVEATYDSHWYLDRHEYTELVTGKKFKRLVIEDLEGCRLAKLKAMTAVQIGETVYKFSSKDSFVSGIPSYKFKIYPAGERI